MNEVGKSRQRGKEAEEKKEMEVRKEEEPSLAQGIWNTDFQTPHPRGVGEQ